MKSILSIIFAALLSSCANIPLSTMMKMRSFDEHSFMALQPGELRAKILVDRPIELSVPRSKLALEIETLSGTASFDFPLVQLAAQILPAEESWLSSTPERTEYELMLSDVAIADFYQLQSSIAEKLPQDYSLNVTTGLNSVPDQSRALTLSILMKLSADSEYITVIDRAAVELDTNK